MSRTTLLALAGSALFAIAAATWLIAGGALFESADASAPMMCSGGRCCCARRKIMAGGADLAGDRLTMDPEQFVGPVKDAYQFAGQTSGADFTAMVLLRMRQDRRSPQPARLLSRQSRRDLRDLHRRSFDGQAVSVQGSPVDQIREAIRQRYESAE